MTNRETLEKEYPNYKRCIKDAFELGQSHIFRWWDEITPSEKKHLLEQTATIDFINKIKDFNVIDKSCREKMKENNLPDYSHSTGHGVGLEVHEYPRVAQTSLDQSTNNQVFTIEPGTYFSGKFGLRIEDTILIDNHQTRILTQLRKSPIVLNL